jgi:hypothetical protein
LFPLDPGASNLDTLPFAAGDQPLVTAEQFARVAFDFSEGTPGDAARESLRLVSARLMPCGDGACSGRLQLVLQPTNGSDAAIHAFYTLDQLYIDRYLSTVVALRVVERQVARLVRCGGTDRGHRGIDDGRVAVSIATSYEPGSLPARCHALFDQATLARRPQQPNRRSQPSHPRSGCQLHQSAVRVMLDNDEFGRVSLDEPVVEVHETMRRSAAIPRASRSGPLAPSRCPWAGREVGDHVAGDSAAEGAAKPTPAVDADDLLKVVHSDLRLA